MYKWKHYKIMRLRNRPTPTQTRLHVTQWIVPFLIELRSTITALIVWYLSIILMNCFYEVEAAIFPMQVMRPWKIYFQNNICSFSKVLILTFVYALHWSCEEKALDFSLKVIHLLANIFSPNNKQFNTRLVVMLDIGHTYMIKVMNTVTSYICRK